VVRQISSHRQYEQGANLCFSVLVAHDVLRVLWCVKFVWAGGHKTELQVAINKEKKGYF
jgi:hypothetical protein